MRSGVSSGQIADLNTNKHDSHIKETEITQFMYCALANYHCGTHRTYIYIIFFFQFSYALS